MFHMRIIALKTLRAFYDGRSDYVDAKEQLLAWYQLVKRAQWRTPADVKNQYRNASFIGNNRIVFNIAGNKYRLIVEVNYSAKIVYIRFVGTHKEYDKIDPKEV